ncbi:MAG: hypothetical protein RIR91_76 [Verrucomicrobiota bacterium]
MGLTADTTGIQFRLLNSSKGPAVQAPRAQCDKKAYQFRMKHLCELQPGLTIFQAMVTGLIFEGGAVVGVNTNLDLAFYGRTVVVTTGTFLRGLMHIGNNKTEGGRLGDFSAKSLRSNPGTPPLPCLPSTTPDKKATCSTWNNAANASRDGLLAATKYPVG